MENIDKKLDKALNQEFDFQLPADFTNQVLIKVKEKEAKTDKNMFWWITGLSILLLASAAGILIYYGNLSAFKPLLSYVPWLFIGAGLVTVIQILDQKLVKEKLNVS